MIKRNKIIYWISTIWLASGMLSTGTLQLFKVKAEGALAPPGVYDISRVAASDSDCGVVVFQT